jgi:hypothetical protein
MICCYNGIECEILQEDRERLIVEVTKRDNWPINKDMLIKKHYKAFAKIHERDGKNQRSQHMKRNKT